MVTKFKLRDEVCMENTPHEKLIVSFIEGNKIHCINSSSRQVIADATMLIRFSPAGSDDFEDINLN